MSNLNSHPGKTIECFQRVRVSVRPTALFSTRKETSRTRRLQTEHRSFRRQVANADISPFSRNSNRVLHSEADILGGADTIHPQGGVFFIEESRRALSPIRSASPDGVPTSTAPRIRPSSAAAASTNEKKERKSRWKRLLPSALMRRAGKSRKTKGDVVDERVGKTQTIVIRVPTGRRIDSLESLGIVAGRSVRGEEKGRFQVKRLVSDGLAEKRNEIRVGEKRNILIK